MRLLRRMNRQIDEVKEMSHAEKALTYYGSNFNCSQSVFTAFATEMGMDEQTALRLGTNFGGGARKGEMCGAVSGALMVLVTMVLNVTTCSMPSIWVARC